MRYWLGHKTKYFTSHFSFTTIS